MPFLKNTNCRSGKIIINRGKTGYGKEFNPFPSLTVILFLSHWVLTFKGPFPRGNNLMKDAELRNPESFTLYFKGGWFFNVTVAVAKAVSYRILVPLPGLK